MRTFSSCLLSHSEMFIELNMGTLRLASNRTVFDSENLKWKVFQRQLRKRGKYMFGFSLCVANAIIQLWIARRFASYQNTRFQWKNSMYRVDFVRFCWGFFRDLTWALAKTASAKFISCIGKTAMRYEQHNTSNRISHAHTHILRSSLFFDIRRAVKWCPNIHALKNWLDVFQAKNEKQIDIYSRFG